MKKMDERQRLDILKAERAAFYVMWLILAASVIIQAYILERNIREYGWELAAFLAGCIVYICASTRKGIWDTRIKPNKKKLFSLQSGGYDPFYGSIRYRKIQKL